jgi:hypothetical protein
MSTTSIPPSGDADPTRLSAALHVVPATRVACSLRVVVPTFNAEFISERDGGPCTQPAVARLTVRHDGAACGCEGWCRFIDPNTPGAGLRPPWTEVLLMCVDHAHEYTSATRDAVLCPAYTYEVLS